MGHCAVPTSYRCPTEHEGFTYQVFTAMTGASRAVDERVGGVGLFGIACEPILLLFECIRGLSWVRMRIRWSSLVRLGTAP